SCVLSFFFFFQAEDGIRDRNVTGVQTCALPILSRQCRHHHSLPASPPSSRQPKPQPTIFSVSCDSSFLLEKLNLAPRPDRTSAPPFTAINIAHPPGLVNCRRPSLRKVRPQKAPGGWRAGCRRGQRCCYAVAFVSNSKPIIQYSVPLAVVTVVAPA